jgi:hypothetical protein
MCWALPEWYIFCGRRPCVSGRKNPLDTALGVLSYPIYLIHSLVTMIIPGGWGEYLIRLDYSLCRLANHGRSCPIERFGQYRARGKPPTRLLAVA